MIDLLDKWFTHIEYASRLISVPLIIILFFIFTYQMVKIYHYVKNRPFPTAFGYGSLIMVSFAECLVRSFYPKAQNLADCVFLLSLTACSQLSVTWLQSTKVDIKDFYSKMQLHVQVATFILGIVGIGIFVKIYAEKELVDRNVNHLIANEALKVAKDLVKAEHEKNLLLQKDTLFKKEVKQSLIKVATKIELVHKQIDTAKKERVETNKLAKRNGRKLDYLNSKTNRVGKLNIKQYGNTSYNTH